MKRRIIEIDQKKCNGCGACAIACHEGAIDMVDGKATLLREDYCDGLGDCLPACPENAITFVEKEAAEVPLKSHLRQWPVQMKLIPVSAPWLDGAKLLIAADCTAYAYANFHRDFMKDCVTLVGCPKLDAIDYSIKLTEILRTHDIKEITVVRMEVPCCGGIEFAVKKALQDSGKAIPWNVVTLSVAGEILNL